MVQQQAATSLSAQEVVAVHHKLSVTIQVDLDGTQVQIIATGHLTQLNQSALHSLIHRARTLTPGIRVIVDLSGARHVDPTGVDLLRGAIGPDPHHPDQGPVQLVLPTPPPTQALTTTAPIGAASRPAPKRPSRTAA